MTVHGEHTFSYYIPFQNLNMWSCIFFFSAALSIYMFKRLLSQMVDLLEDFAEKSTPLYLNLLNHLWHLCTVIASLMHSTIILTAFMKFKQHSMKSVLGYHKL